MRPDTLNHLTCFAGSIDMEGYGDLRIAPGNDRSKICFEDDLKVVNGLRGRILYDQTVWQQEKAQVVFVWLSKVAYALGFFYCSRSHPCVYAPECEQPAAATATDGS